MNLKERGNDLYCLKPAASIRLLQKLCHSVLWKMVASHKKTRFVHVVSIWQYLSLSATVLLDQTCKTHGPRAACGSLRAFVWPMSEVLLHDLNNKVGFQNTVFLIWNTTLRVSETSLLSILIPNTAGLYPTPSRTLITTKETADRKCLSLFTHRPPPAAKLRRPRLEKSTSHWWTPGHKHANSR